MKRLPSHTKSMIVSLTLFVLLCGCTSGSNTQSNQQDDGIVHLKALNNEREPSKKQPAYSKVEFVKLETNENCLIKKMKHIVTHDSLLFIQADYSDHLFIFDRKGNFITQIGHKGQGTGEYIKISTFFIDKADQSVVIVDDFTNVFLYYGFDGAFKRKMDVPREVIGLLDKAMMSDDGKLLLNFLLCTEDYAKIQPHFRANTAYRYVVLANWDVLDSKSYAPIKATETFFPIPYDAISQTKTGFHFIMPLCDTIFACHNDTFVPAYIIEHKQKMMPTENITLSIENSPSTLARTGYNNKQFTGFTGLFETDKHLLLPYYHGGQPDRFFSFFLANKETREGTYCVLASSIDEKMKDVPIFYRILGTDNQSVISMIDPNNIPASKEGIANNTHPNMAQLKAILEDFDEEDNPLLLFHTFE